MHTLDDAPGASSWSDELADRAPPSAPADPAVITVDGDGRIEAVSPRAARWLGVSAWQVRGRALAELGWALGPAALVQVAEMVRGGAPTATVRVTGRRERTTTLVLSRAGGRAHLTLAV